MAAVTFSSSRFGTVEVDEDAVIDFPRGLIGLGGSKFAVVGQPDDAIVWLHALDDPDLAVPVADPWSFFADYVVDLSDEDVERLGVADPSAATVFVVVRAGATPQECFANLKAPVLVTGRTGHQVLNEADVPLRAPLAPDEEAS